MDTKELKKYKDALKNMSETEQPAKQKRNADTKQMIAAMRTEIKELIQNGYSYEQVLKTLADSGMILKESTLKSYLFKKQEEETKTNSKPEPKKETKVKTGKDKKQKEHVAEKPSLKINQEKSRTSLDDLTDDE